MKWLNAYLYNCYTQWNLQCKDNPNINGIIALSVKIPSKIYLSDQFHKNDVHSYAHWVIYVNFLKTF